MAGAAPLAGALKGTVTALFDAFWRACAYCMHPRVLLWSMLPLVLAAALVGGLGWAFWEPAVSGLRQAIESWDLSAPLLRWLDSLGWQRMRSVLAPLLLVALAVPVVLLVCLLLVALLMTPTVVRMVVARRFADLQPLQGATWAQSLVWSLLCTAVALLALLLSLPLWFVPPLVMILPPLIWGWLTCRVLAFDTLAFHASAAERRFLLRQQRWPLLAMGIFCGFLGSLPSLIWVLGVPALIFAPLLGLVSVWLYTVVFAFATCWFAHYTLAALDRLRRHRTAVPAPVAQALENDAPVLLNAPRKAA